MQTTLYGETDNGDGVLVTNHWGKWVISNQPTTGVISCHSLEWIHDEVNYHAVTNLSYDSYLEYGINDLTNAWQRDNDTEESPPEEMLDQWRDQLGGQYEESGDTYLIGAWHFDSYTQFWEIDKTEDDPEKSFAAIVDYDFAGGIVQVVWSRICSHGALCSPCCPGQVDLDTSGDYMGYDLPLSFYGEYRQNDTPQFSTPTEDDKYTYWDSTDIDEGE